MSHSSFEKMTNSFLPMSFESTELLVRQTIAKRLHINMNEVQRDTNFHDLNFDSLDLTELLFLLEDQIKRQINVDKIANLLTVNDVVRLVMKNQ